MCGGCCDGMCGKCRAGKLVIGGALVLLNIYVWPQWGVAGKNMPGIDGWFAFIAALLIIKGVLKFIMPSCPHCKAEAMPAKKGK